MGDAQVTPQLRSNVSERLQAVVMASMSHPLWKSDPSQNHPTLYFTFDFVMRSIYMVSEYDNIKDGKPIEHPEQIKTPASLIHSIISPAQVGSSLASIQGTGETAALKVFQEACGRTMMLELLVNDTSGMTAMLTGNSGPKVDYGQDVKAAVADLDKAIPSQHKMAGMTG